MSLQEIVHLPLPPRGPQQLNMMRGSPNALSISVFSLVCLLVISVMVGGEEVVIFELLGIAPAAAVLAILHRGKNYDFSTECLLDFFWTGCFASVAIAFILEAVTQVNTADVWRCATESPSLVCDSMLVLVIFVGVGFVEEFAKFVSLARVAVSEKSLPYKCSWWFRLVDCPLAYVLAGCASAAGFATIENLQYIKKAADSSLMSGVATSALRLMLAVPFHICCTGIAAATAADFLFPPYFMDEIIPQERAPMSQRLPLWGILYSLTLPSLLHALYDGGLILAAQFGSVDGSEKELPGFLRRLTAGIIPTAAPPATAAVTGLSKDTIYQWGVGICLGVSFGSFLICIFTFIVKYRRLIRQHKEIAPKLANRRFMMHQYHQANVMVNGGILLTTPLVLPEPIQNPNAGTPTPILFFNQQDGITATGRNS